jgi:hypothetical protein
MRSISLLSTSLLALAFLGACGQAGDTEADPPTGESAMESGMSAAEATLDLSCWLAEGTMAEAMERPSPRGETEIDLSGHLGRVCYGRPFARDRVVEGGLIPFGEPWRMGADEATTIHLTFPASIGGIEVEAGRYSIYAIAGEFEWEFVLNSVDERWGIPINEDVEATNIGTFTGMPRTMTEPVEQFTIHWHTHGGDNGHVVLEWGTTRVEFEVSLLDHVH